DGAEFFVIASDAQLLRFPTDSVRPQGRQASGMTAMNLKGDAQVIFATAVDTSEGGTVVTVAGSTDALPGVGGTSVKISDATEFPAKGRATGGVRAHRFLKGEDVLVAAWVGTG